MDGPQRDPEPNHTPEDGNAQDPQGKMALRAVRDTGGEIVDFEWIMTDPVAETLLERSPGDLVGKRMLEIYPGLGVGPLFRRLVAVVDRRRPAAFEHRFRRSGRDVVLTLIVRCAGDQLLVHVRRSAMKSPEIPMEEVFDRASVPLVVMDDDGSIVRANRAWREKLGRVVGSREGDRIEACAHPDDAAEIGTLVRRVFAGEIVHSAACRAHPRIGGWLVLDLVPISSPGLALGFVHLAACEAPSPTAPLEPTRDSDTLRVLVVDDNIVSQQQARGALERLGHESSAAGNGREAVAAVQGSRFDALLMDLVMPVMDGFEAAACIRAIERGHGRHLPIIAIGASSVHRDRCLDAGMDGILEKPIDCDALRDALASLPTDAAPAPAESERTVTEQIIAIATALTDETDHTAHEALSTMCEGIDHGDSKMIELARKLEAAARVRDLSRLESVTTDIKAALTELRGAIPDRR